MSELQTHERTSLVDQNYELLRSSEFGVVLTRAYIGAVNHSPQIAGVRINEMPEDWQHTAAARPGWSEFNKTDGHEVFLRMRDLDAILDHYQEALAVRPAFVEHVSRLLRIDTDDMTPQLAYTFSLLHELGHANDFVNHEAFPQFYEVNKQLAEQSLPVGRIPTALLLDETSSEHRSVMADKNLFAKYKVKTMQELLAVSQSMYRDMPHEKVADEFAVEVLERDPQLKAWLMRDTIEPYRNFPGFGEAE